MCSVMGGLKSGFHEFVLLRIVYVFYAVHEVTDALHFLVFGESGCHTLAYSPVTTLSVKLWSVVVAAVYTNAVLVVTFDFEGDGSVHGVSPRHLRERIFSLLGTHYNMLSWLVNT